MKIIKQNEANRFKNGKTCIAFEYELGDKDINGAVVELTGRYPNKGRVVNTVCKEIVYVLEGSGKIVIENKELEYSSGDLIYIEPNERYFWDGKSKIFASCAPAWYAEQHQETD